MKVFVWLYSSGSMCCSVGVCSKEQEMDNIVRAFIKYFYESGLVFLPCVLVSRLDLYQNEDVCMHLQLLNHNSVPDAKNSCTRLGDVSKGFLLGG